MLCGLLSPDTTIPAAWLGSVLLSDDFAWQRGYTWYGILFLVMPIAHDRAALPIDAGLRRQIS